VRLLILTEVSDRSRVWEGAIPLLQDNDVEVTLATVRGAGPIHKRVAELGAQALALGCETGADYPAAAIRLSRRLRGETFDVLHACEAIPAAIGGVAASLARTDARVYHWQHSRSQGKQRLLSRVGGRLSKLVVACSRSAADYAVEDEGVPSNRVRVVYNGVAEPRAVESGEIREIKDRLGIEPEAHVVSMVTRLRPEKGVTTLLDSVPAISRASERAVHVVIAGDGPQRTELEARATAVNGGRTHFVGHQDDVSPWFELADVVAMPSHREAFVFTAAEALASRRPLVASAVGGLTEIIEDGVSGRLVRPQDPAELASAVSELLTSPSEAERLGSAGYSRYRKLFTMDAMVNGWLRAYRELI
jgi:glycosyltransferase involved in cell wall biosynthesis